MGFLRYSLSFCLFLSLSSAALAEHNHLLPQPQKTQYGSGQIPVRGLEIRLESSPSSEDRFAAEELAKALSARAGVAVPVREGSVHGMTIALTRTGAVDSLPMPDEKPGPQSREAYSIRVKPGGVEIRARSSAGVFYGVQTLCQLVEGEGERAVLPEAEIEDWPSLAYRGTMVDMSHGPLPREEEIKRQLDFLAHWKGNQYYFYSEASIELRGYPLLNPDGRFSEDQVQRIIAYARERHIDVVPCVELYGHIHDLFRIERYGDLASVTHGWDFNPRDPRGLALLSDWVEQLSKLFPSPFFHIGMDETLEVEKAAADNHAPPAELYLEHLQKVSEFVRRQNKRVLVWGDMLLEYPELIPRLPSGTIVVTWHYEAEKDYERFVVPFAAAHVPLVVGSGLWDWNEIFPDFSQSFENINGLLTSGREHGALGLINTLWQEEVYVLRRPALPGIAYGAVASWQPGLLDPTRFFDDYAHNIYPVPVAAEVIPALKALTQSQNHLRRAVGKGDIYTYTLVHLWDDPFDATHLERSKTHRDDLRQTRLLAEDAQEHLYKALSLGGDPSTLSSVLFESRLLDYAATKNIFAVEMAEFHRQLGLHPKRKDVTLYLRWESGAGEHGRVRDLMDTAKELREAFRAAALVENTPYRLGTELGRFDAEYEYWRSLQARLLAFAEAFQDGDPLPPLESLFGPKR